MREDLTRSEIAPRPLAEASLSKESQLADVALLTAGKDKPYALGLSAALIEKGLPFEVLGSNFVDAPILHNNPLVTYRNLRGDQAEHAPLPEKIVRIFRYYRKLLAYAIKARPRVFHIHWNNKFEWFDRTILLLFYRMCGRKLVYTAHNVNIGERDGTDSFMNRLTLRMQYRLVDDVFVHTERMSAALQKGFKVPAEKIHVIPFPMNNTVPDTALDTAMARERLGLRPDERVLLAYGAIAPYKGLEYLVEALTSVARDGVPYRLIIAGGVKKGAEEYWRNVQQAVSQAGMDSLVLTRIEYIPDEETEIYFKAADALVLSYTHIFQSGVLFLGYNFGLPVLAADVGAFKESVVESKTGFIFRPKDSMDLARVIRQFFESDIYRDLPARRKEIRAFAAEQYSWSRAASSILEVYSRLLGTRTQRV
jgi:glycosyltransferase involved in cell wall biosynthesis